MNNFSYQAKQIEIMDKLEWELERQRFIGEIVDKGLDIDLDSEPPEFTEEEWCAAVQAYIEKYTDGGEYEDLDKCPAHLKGFCRVYPRAAQDVMVVFAEPKLGTADKENELTEDNYKLATTDDMAKREEISMSGSYLNWERDKTGPVTRIHTILERTAEQARDSDVVSIPELAHIDPDSEHAVEEIHDEIYVTNFFKFATGDDSIDLEQFEYSAIRWLDKEIRAVDPDIVFLFGATPWEGVRDRVEPLAHTADAEDVDDPSSANVTTATGYPFRMHHQEVANPTVIPRNHPTVAKSSTDWTFERIAQVVPQE